MIHSKIANILQKVDAIAKDQTNVQQKYKFRGIDDVYNALQPLFKAERVFCTPETLEERREQITGSEGKIRFYVFLKVKFTYFAEDGSSVSLITNGEGMDSGDKATNKAMSAAHKYSLIQMFMIPTQEGSHDSDKNTPDELEEEIEFEIQRIGDQKSLQEYWAANKELHTNKRFKDLMTARKAAIAKTAK